MKYTTLALFAAIAIASTPALAHRGSEHHGRFANPQMAAAHQALENRDDLLKRRSLTMRIGAVERQEIAEEREEIRELQERLENGDRIDGHTLYRALGSNHPIYFAS
ncbi:MAG: hypothetical protein ACREI7_00150 [Myxococcota bacterium]